MNTTDIITIISSLGFPIFCCLILFFYVYKTNDQNREDIKSLNEKYNENYKEFTQALNNNTLALQRLTDKLERRENE